LICLTQAGLLLESKKSNRALYRDALLLDVFSWFGFTPWSLATEAVCLFAQLLWLPQVPNGQRLFCPRTIERTKTGGLQTMAMICQSHVNGKL
jgi:hypothetical protein